MATDCGVTTFFAQLAGSAWRFCGTSAAAPHAAGVAALMLQAKRLQEPKKSDSPLEAVSRRLAASAPAQSVPA